MAAITVSTALSELRALLRDTNSAAPAFTDAQGIIALNIAHLWWHENMERRTKRYDRSSPFTFTGAVTTWTNGAAYMETNWSSDHAEILEVALDGLIAIGGTNSAIPLERMDWGELRHRQYGAQLTTAQPTHWSGIKLQASHAWRLALYPIANEESLGTGWTIVGIVRVEPTPLVNTTDTIDLGDSETRSMILLGAILLAPLVNRPELAEGYKALLPERVREKMETTAVHDEVNA